MPNGIELTVSYHVKSTSTCRCTCTCREYFVDGMSDAYNNEHIIQSETYIRVVICVYSLFAVAGCVAHWGHSQGPRTICIWDKVVDTVLQMYVWVIYPYSKLKLHTGRHIVWRVFTQLYILYIVWTSKVKKAAVKKSPGLYVDLCKKYSQKPPKQQKKSKVFYVLSQTPIW